VPLGLWLRAAGIAALVTSGLVQAQAYCDPRVNADCYKRWCSQVAGGKPVYRGNWGCDMSGARSTPSYSGGTSGAELGAQIGGALGGLIREGLFGNPQQNAARQAAMEEQRRLQEAENRRRAEEIARQDEERFQRLKNSLLAFTPSPQLSLMGGASQSGGLQLMLGDDAERSLNPALAELSRAAAWSTLAARASTPEEAVLFADAAFRTAVGDKVTLPTPPADVKGVPVGPSLPEVERLKKEYLAHRAQLPAAWKPALDAMEEQDRFMRLESDARQFELRMYQGKRRENMERARQAAEEASRLRQQKDEEANRAFAAAASAQAQVNGLAQSLRAWLSSFAAGTRKPDSYYHIGFEDGSQCFSQNAGPRCDKAGAPKADYENCLASYRLGYSAGERIKASLLQAAYEKGQSDGGVGRSYADTDTRADGPCRAQYLMSYNSGRMGVPQPKFGR
jgi:hypothetical protein